MRHIMISSLLLGAQLPQPYLYYFPQPQRPISSYILFLPSRLYTFSAVLKRGLIIWRQGPGIFLRACPSDTTVAPADTNLCEDADVSRRSFHCHYIIPVYLEQSALHTQLWTAASSSNKPSTEFTIFEFHQHSGAVPKALCRKKRSVLHQRTGLRKRSLLGLDFLKGNLG